jgi:hypothetical protein
MTTFETLDVALGELKQYNYWDVYNVAIHVATAANLNKSERNILVQHAREYFFIAMKSHGVVKK